MIFKVYSAIIGYNVLKMAIKSFDDVLNFSISLYVKEISNYNVDLIIFLVNDFRFTIMHFESLLLGAYMLEIVISC